MSFAPAGQLASPSSEAWTLENVRQACSPQITLVQAMGLGLGQSPILADVKMGSRTHPSPASPFERGAVPSGFAQCHMTPLLGPGKNMPTATRPATAPSAFNTGRHHLPDQCDIGSDPELQWDASWSLSQTNRAPGHVLPQHDACNIRAQPGSPTCTVEGGSIVGRSCERAEYARGSTALLSPLLANTMLAPLEVPNLESALHDRLASPAICWTMGGKPASDSNTSQGTMLQWKDHHCQDWYLCCRTSTSQTRFAYLHLE